MFLSLVTLEKENYYHKLFELFKFDSDIIGMTGIDYVDEKAKSMGLKSTLDLFIYEANKQHTEYKDIVQSVIVKFKNYPANKEFYKQMDVRFENLDDKMVVAFSAL